MSTLRDTGRRGAAVLVALLLGANVLATAPTVRADASPPPTAAPLVAPVPVLVPLVPVTGSGPPNGRSRGPRWSRRRRQGSEPAPGARRGGGPAVPAGPAGRAGRPRRPGDAGGRHPEGSHDVARQPRDRPGRGRITPPSAPWPSGAPRCSAGTRIGTLARGRSSSAEPPGAHPSTFAPASAWTMVAGGDVMLDRYVYRRTVIDGLGANYP